jgi:glycosyltransferase involved in cell wall biosynthesis
MQNPLFSVIIPVYNRPNELKRSLNSLTTQTYLNFEVIIVDDGSSEDIKSVVDRYITQLDIVFIRIENSGGPARPRNTGIRASKAKWISFLDSDDWWCPSRIAEVSEEIARHPQFDVFYHKLKTISGNAKRHWWSSTTLGFSLSPNPFLDLMTLGNALPNSAVVIRKSSFDKYGYFNESQQLSSVEDFDYWLMLAYNHCQFYFIDKCLGFYWISSSGISADPEKTIRCNRLILDKYIAYLDKNEMKSATSKFYYFAGSVLCSSEYKERAAKYLTRARHLSGYMLRLKRIFKLFTLYLCGGL